MNIVRDTPSVIPYIKGYFSIVPRIRHTIAWFLNQVGDYLFCDSMNALADISGIILQIERYV